VTSKNQSETNGNADIVPTPAPQRSSGQVMPCCVTTIRQHAIHNPMMVCTECKQIIKCFLDEKAFRNYLKFCQSRHRKFTTGVVDDYQTIVYKPYQTTTYR
jgi:hypothetical protein